MEFCDFTLDHLLGSLKANRDVYTDLPKLFQNITSYINFKEDRSNSKFGAFCPLFIICQLLEGLIFIHDLGIVHRDLKPANIFLMQNGKVKIGDFGLSKDLSKKSGSSKHQEQDFTWRQSFCMASHCHPQKYFFPPQTCSA